MANPIYTASVVQNPPEGSDRKALWHQVGAVFANRQGDGMTLVINPQISVSGRIVLMPYKEREADRPDTGPAQRSGTAPRGPR